MALTTQTQPPDLSPNKECSIGTDTASPSPPDQDVELQAVGTPADDPHKKVSAFKSLGLLDRFLAVWVLLAIVIGIILRNFVPNTSPTP